MTGPDVFARKDFENYFGSLSTGHSGSPADLLAVAHSWTLGQHLNEFMP
jgi:hypothetical protein